MRKWKQLSFQNEVKGTSLHKLSIYSYIYIYNYMSMTHYNLGNSSNSCIRYDIETDLYIFRASNIDFNVTSK